MKGSTWAAVLNSPERLFQSEWLDRWRRDPQGRGAGRRSLWRIKVLGAKLGENFYEVYTFYILASHSINLMLRYFCTNSCCFGKEEGVLEEAEKMKRLHFQTGAKYFTGEHQMWKSSVLPLGFPNYRFQLADEMEEEQRSGRPQEIFTNSLCSSHVLEFWVSFPVG